MTAAAYQFGMFGDPAELPASGRTPAAAPPLPERRTAAELLAQLYRPINRPQISTPEDAAAILAPLLIDLEQESMYVLLLDTKNRAIGEPVEVFRGSLNSTHVRMADLFRIAVRENAAALVLAHNHPSGEPTPSAEDARVTVDIVMAGKVLDIDVVDHLVIASSGHVSLKQRGLGFR